MAWLRRVLRSIFRSIVLIGFSGTGKTPWGQYLAAAGYVLVCVDAEIEKMLGPHLTSLGYTGTSGMEKWQGQPYDARHARNSALYLKYEKQVMWRVIWRMLKGEKLVVDTTGSVIYTGWLLLKILHLVSTFVLLDTPESRLNDIRQKYFDDPKPVLWKDRTFIQHVGEKGVDALRRCFPDLLRTRNVRYKKLAHVTLDYDVIRQLSYTVDHFLMDVQRKLKWG